MKTAVIRTVSAESATWSPPLPDAGTDPAGAPFTHLIVDTPGLRSHVASIGDREPVVLLHGFPEHWWQWREVI